MLSLFKKPRLLLFLTIFCLVLASRVGIALYSQNYQVSDDIEMTRAAATLAREGTLGNIYGPDSGPSAHVAPLYPFLLSILYRLFGIETPPGLLAQAILAATTTALAIALLPLLGEKLRLGAGAGLGAAALMTFLPLNLFVEISGSWEQPLTFLALELQLFAFQDLHENGWRSWTTTFGLGVLLALSALLSPVLVLTPAIAVLAEVGMQTGRRLQVFFAAVILVLVGVVMLAPWTYRNYRELGGWTLIRSNAGLELYLGNHDLANGKVYINNIENIHPFYLASHPYTSAKARSHLKEIGEVPYMEEKGRLAQNWIKENPGHFVYLCLTRFRLYWFPPGHLWPPSTGKVALKVIVFSILGGATFIGLALLFAARHPSRWLLLAATLGPSLPYLITHVDFRYRYTTYWASALLLGHCAAMASEWLWRMWKPQRTNLNDLCAH